MEDLSNTRVWLFQADRILSSAEIEMLNGRLSAFISTWSTHGAKLKAWISVEYDLVIKIIIDQDIMKASGCSIDKMTHVVRELGDELNVNFFNRENVAILNDDEIQLIHFRLVEAKIKAGELSLDHLMLDNLIDNGVDLADNWIKPISKSWLNRFITV